MEQDFVTYLPSEIIVNILSRLPIRSIIMCKRVCKSWLDLLGTPEFVRSHNSKSVPGLAVFERNPQIKPYKVVEFVDELDPNFDGHRWNAVSNFNIPFHVPVCSAANGLLFWWNPDFFIICNPITRDYIILQPSPREITSYVLMASCGFGVSRISGQYKVVGMFFKKKIDASEVSRPQCRVYSVGTGSWRRISSAGVPNNFHEYGEAAFLNGNLHWLARAWDLLENHVLISCFDLETELFSTSSPPPRDDLHRFRTMSVLGGCLCLCDTCEDYLTYEYDIIIWLMKEYGDEKSWTKEFVIRPMMLHGDFLGFFFPIKVFEDGDILMEMGMERLVVYYSNKTKTIREVDVSGSLCTAISYTPSFVSLKTIAMEKAYSF